jgi:hypothetical protein
LGSVPAGPESPLEPPQPDKNVYGEMDIGNCSDGYIWFKYDEGDAGYGQADVFKFRTHDLEKLPTNRKIDFWMWVDGKTATYIQKTGRHPVPRSIRLGMYAYKAKEYADLYGAPAFKLARGKIAASDVIFTFADNVDTIVGFLVSKIPMRETKLTIVEQE